MVNAVFFPSKPKVEKSGVEQGFPVIHRPNHNIILSFSSFFFDRGEVAGGAS